MNCMFCIIMLKGGFLKRLYAAGKEKIVTFDEFFYFLYAAGKEKTASFDDAQGYMLRATGKPQHLLNFFYSNSFSLKTAANDYQQICFFSTSAPSSHLILRFVKSRCPYSNCMIKCPNLPLC